MQKQIGVLFIGLALASAANAAPRAQSALECGVAADMAIVARSLAQENIKEPQAGSIMSRIYDVSGSDRGRQLMEDIIAAAYSKTAATNEKESASTGASAENPNSSKKFAEDLFAACMKTGGNMDGILGKRL